MVRRFAHVAAIDWSGQNVARPKGLAVALAAAGDAAPVLAQEPWSRDAIGRWLLSLADAGTDILIGVDLSPGFPFTDRGAYFPGWPRSPADAKALWRLVDDLSADSPHLSAAGFLADPDVLRHFRTQAGTGAAFGTGRGRLRVCEVAQAAMGLSPSSCLNLIGAAQVGKSSLTGMRVLHRLRGRVPVWPFDPVPATGPVLVEIYTSLAARAAGVRRGLSKLRDEAPLAVAMAALGSEAPATLARHDDHATDALLTAAWLRTAAHDPALWHPSALTPAIARTEGWTFGVP
jgi:hypothetical protein